ncbi:MAG: tRNA glutamyl-Q(34) synthetase GluQRS [Rhodoferax sp.]|uniref:tRNA glutamyl-Q(34) synthetase GluQRS n=1 Tax=Rhodoferax sp. TaxID=50421 RepID=UPI0032669756
MGATYIGRFAPSPTGPLHAGSLVAALASWLDARAHGGHWLVRIEDVDSPRCLPGVDTLILQQLAACGLVPDAEPTYQSQRSPLYQQALDQLVASGWAYPCACSRKDIAQALIQKQPRQRHAELVYPGTCRHGLQGRPARAWRFYIENRLPAQVAPAEEAINTIVNWQDRCLGPQQQNLAAEVGDFVLRRADGLWAYQLAVVVDDAAQGITHVVRGQDLADNTPRQIGLQQALDLPTPQYLHTPLVLGANGEKLSKQNGAQALDLGSPLAALNAAAQVLGLHPGQGHCADALAAWIPGWRALYNPAL